MRKPYLLIALLIITCSTSIYSATSSNYTPRILPGVLDLRNWDPHTTPVIKISEGWQFVWNRFLESGDTTLAALAGLRDQTRPLNATQRWTLHLTGYPDLPEFGYGSYIIKVLLPNNCPPISLDVGAIGSSARILWAGNTILEIGKPGISPSKTISQIRSDAVTLPDEGTEVYLIIQVANWDDVSPGLVESPRIGEAATIDRQRDQTIAITYLILGIFLFMGIYHLFLFLFRTQELAPLYFSAICILFGLRVLVTDALLASIIFPGMELRATLIISYLTYTLPLLLFVFFVTNLFRFAWNPVIRWFASVTTLAYSVLIVLTPASIFTQVLYPFHIVALVIGLSLLTVLIFAMVKRHQNAILFFIGFIVVMSSAAFDILKSILQWEVPTMVPYGIVVFVFFLSLVLTRRSAAAIWMAERLSRHLQRVNSAMIRFVPRDFLTRLNREDITTVKLGEFSQRNMTVMVANIRGFSRIAGNLSADATFQLLNRYLAVMGPIIRTHNGFVDQYNGDGLVALFPDDATSAIHAALAMIPVMSEVNEERRRLAQEEVDIGIGIHYGSVMMGTVGENNRLSSAIVSEALVLSSRLQGLTRDLGGHILVSFKTLRFIPLIADFQNRHLGNFKIYNREEAVSVYEFYDCEPPMIWEQKRAGKRDFERAVNLYQIGQLEQAFKIFTKLAIDCPDDQAINYYLQRIKLQNDPS